jgi:DNA processing protein
MTSLQAVLGTAAVDRDLLRLTLVPGIGPLRLAMLRESFPTAAAILAASAPELRAAGLPANLAETLGTAAAEADVDGVIADCEAGGIHVWSATDATYPQPLASLPDTPPLLYARGDWQPADARAIALVGSRHATAYGLRMTERLATGLVEHGYTVVSGLARGIDAMAHRAALRAGGRTLAVLGSGLLAIYPPEHRGLADEIAERGGVISEFSPRTPPRAGQFPQRNRLLSGLARGVVVVEAGARSGSLITVRMALEQGREVFAVPGPADLLSSRGCHALIRDGARLVESIDDILAELDPLFSADGEPATPQSAVATAADPSTIVLEDPQQRAVYSLIGQEPTLIDEVIVRSSLLTHQALASIAALELRRLIRRTGGPYVQRVGSNDDTVARPRRG